MNPTLQRLLDTKLIAVLRSDNGDALIEVARALLAGGVDAMEVTFTVPKATRVIEAVADALWVTELCWEPGPYSIPKRHAPRCWPGRSSLSLPTRTFGVIEICRRYSVPVMPRR